MWTENRSPYRERGCGKLGNTYYIIQRGEWVPKDYNLTRGKCYTLKDVPPLHEIT